MLIELPDAWAWYLLLIPAGFLAGIVNTIAGGGSFLTLPALMFFVGLDPRMANGTNRVAILLSSASSSVMFHKHGHLDRRLAVRLVVPTLLGVPFGALMAVYLPPETFQPAFGVLFLVMALVLVLNPARLTEKVAISPRAEKYVTPLFFGIGLYVGFIQAGMGVLLLLGMSLIRSGDLVAANAVKNFIGFWVTLTAMLVFVVYGLVDWLPAITMALGNMAGGVVGAKLAIRKGNKLVLAFLIVVMVLTGIKLLLPG